MAGRRGRGEGSITKRPDGRWMARVDLGWRDGKRRYKAYYGRTRATVQDKLRKALGDVQAGIELPDERQTVEQYLRSWLQHVEKRLRPRAFATYQQAVDLHLVPGVGKIPLARLSPQHLQAWFTEHQAAGATARTIRYARTVLRAALNQALRWGLISRNAAALVEPPRHVARQIQPLNPDQARALLAVAEDHRLGGLVSVALALGLRLGEALGLRWTDVDLDGGVVRVGQALERSGGDPVARKGLYMERRAMLAAAKKQDVKLSDEQRERLAAIRKQLLAARTVTRFTEPKTVRSRRAVRLPDIVTGRLKRHRTKQLEERLLAGKQWQDSGLVFTTTIGTPLHPRNVAREFKGMLANAELPGIRFHDLRHTAATLLLAQGVDPRTIMETLGHSQISLTLNTYSHVLPALQANAATKMDAILNNR